MHLKMDFEALKLRNVRSGLKRLWYFIVSTRWNKLEFKFLFKGAGGVRGEVQTEANQAGGDAVRRWEGLGQSQTARCRSPLPVNNLQVKHETEQSNHQILVRWNVSSISHWGRDKNADAFNIQRRFDAKVNRMLTVKLLSFHDQKSNYCLTFTRRLYAFSWLMGKYPKLNCLISFSYSSACLYNLTWFLSFFLFKIWIPHSKSQQHDCLKARALGLAGRSRGCQAGPGRLGRSPSAGREEKKTDLNRGPGEAIPGGLLRGAASAERGEDRRHRRQAGPEEERGARLVLQPTAEAEEDEVRCADGALRKRRSLGESRAACHADDGSPSPPPPSRASSRQQLGVRGGGGATRGGVRHAWQPHQLLRRPRPCEERVFWFLLSANY